MRLLVNRCAAARRSMRSRGSGAACVGDERRAVVAPGARRCRVGARIRRTRANSSARGAPARRRSSARPVWNVVVGDSGRSGARSCRTLAGRRGDSATQCTSSSRRVRRPGAVRPRVRLADDAHEIVVALDDVGGERRGDGGCVGARGVGARAAPRAWQRAAHRSSREADRAARETAPGSPSSAPSTCISASIVEHVLGARLACGCGTATARAPRTRSAAARCSIGLSRTTVFACDHVPSTTTSVTGPRGGSRRMSRRARARVQQDRRARRIARARARARRARPSARRRAARACGRHRLAMRAVPIGMSRSRGCWRITIARRASRAAAARRSSTPSPAGGSGRTPRATRGPARRGTTTTRPLVHWFADVDHARGGAVGDTRTCDRGQNPEPGCWRNASSAGVESRPRVALRCGNRPKRSTMTLCWRA